MPCDYSKYPSNWKTEIRPAVLKREGNRCKTCKVQNGTWVCRGKWKDIEAFQNDDGQIFRTDTGEYIGSDYVGEVWQETPGKQALIKIVLTISHLDHDVTNNDMSNLAALCQLHHLRHDLQHHKENSRSTRNKNKGLQTLF